MKKLRRHWPQFKKWAQFLLKGITVLPQYISYWGFSLSAKRILKSLILPGANQIVEEIGGFLQMQLSQVKGKRTPDYIVHAPDFTGNSAGIRCLYKLCWDLGQLGFEVAVTGSQRGDANFPVPLLSRQEATAAAAKGAWVIYPEVVNGNPLGARNVVRWALNKPGLLGGDEVYRDHEHVFVYSDVFAPYVKNPIRGRLYMPTLDRSLFYPPAKNSDRTLDCYYIGKSTFKEGLFDTNETFEITRWMPAKSELGKIFRSARVLYSFDNSTALIYEALLCGCSVVIIPDGTQTWNDYEKLELGTAGISWGKPASLPDYDPQHLIDRLNLWEDDYRRQLRFLATYTQKIEATPHFDYLGLSSSKAPEAPSARPAVELSI